MAINNFSHIYNTTPRYDVLNKESGKKGFSSMYRFSGPSDPWKDYYMHPLRCYRACLFPAYVLDPVLYDGGNFPDLQPRSRQGDFFGPSPRHESTVVISCTSRPAIYIPNSMFSMKTGSRGCTSMRKQFQSSGSILLNQKGATY